MVGIEVEDYENGVEIRKVDDEVRVGGLMVHRDGIIQVEDGVWVGEVKDIGLEYFLVRLG